MLKMPRTTCKNLRQSIEAHQGQVVLQNVDCGRVLKFWFVPFSEAELENWWISQPTFCSNPEGELDSLYKMFGEIPPPRSQIEIPGIFLTAKNAQEWNLWRELLQSSRYYSCELCCDTDSFLKKPDGSFLYHSGFEGIKRTNS
ncbi:MAG: hypothetical protein ACKOAS_04225 [Verrucomicrobiota bacterium]